MVALLVLLTVMIFLGVDFYFQWRRSQRSVEVKQVAPPAYAGPGAIPLLEPSYRTPPGVFFEPNHTWLHLEESGVAKLGIDDFARHIIGKIDGADTKSAGDRVERGEAILRVWRGGRAIAFRAPIDGRVEEVNTELLTAGELRGIEPYTASWLYRIQPKDTSLVTKTMVIGAEAKSWLKREVERLKVFLATISPHNPALSTTMQDGGMPASGLITHLSDTEWAKLREKFFD
jgi:glycine cleavage system H lipoate-binding protein